jgi:hypothetical protein
MYSKAQQEVIDRYMESTKDCPESRIPIAKLLKVKKRITKFKSDNAILADCEKQYLERSANRGSGRKLQTINNKLLFDTLKRFDSLAECNEVYSFVDDIVKGVCNLGMGGNTRDLSSTLLFGIISGCCTINSEIISNYCNVEARQAQKIVKSLGIAVSLIERQFKTILGSEEWKEAV